MRHRTLEKLAKERDALFARVRGLPDAALDRARGDGWTIRETLTHLLNAEEDHAKIIALAARGDESRLPASIDLDAHNAERIAARGTLALDALLDAMTAQRARTEALFESMSDEQLDKPFRHPALGETTVGKVFRIIGLHERMHLQEIEAALAGEGAAG